MLNTKSQNQIENLLDLDIYEKIEFDSTLDEGILVILMHFIAAIIFLMTSLVPYFLLSKFSDNRMHVTILRICYYSSMLLSSYMLAEAFIRGTRKYIMLGIFKTEFFAFLCRKRYLKLRVIITFVLFTSLILIVNKNFVLENVNEEFSTFQSHLMTVAIFLSLSMLCVLISGTVVDYLDFYSYQISYKSRVKHNKNVFKFILQMNELLPEDIKDLKTYAKKLYKTILERARQGKTYSEIEHDFENNLDVNSSEDHEKQASEGKKKLERRKSKSKQDYLVKGDFDRLFKRPEMFNLFDFDGNDQVTKYEFVKRYITIFCERDSLKRALEQNAANMFKINILITSLFIPFIIFIFLALAGQLPRLSDSFTMAGLVIFPFTFAFKSVIEEMFTSVIFVFFVKPFDYGDIFLIGADRYQVLNIGILYSDFLLNSKFITFKNTNFNSAQIFNLRKSEFITNTYSFKFDYESYKENEEDFTNELDKYFGKTPSSSYKLGNFKITKNSISLDLETRIVIPYQEIDTIDEKNDAFSLYINDLIDQIGITQI